MPDERIIAALDVRTMEEAKRLVTTLGDAIVYYKVGMELFYAVGPQIITYLKDQKKKIFLDLKLCDIPNTVAEGLVSLMGLGVDLLSVHAFGGYTMLHTAMQRLHAAAAQSGCPAPKVVAITVLTSVGEQDWGDLHIGQPIGRQVESMAELAQRAGVDGVVASPREAKRLREICGRDFLLVTPGVRPGGSASGDQKRTATPQQALFAGADHLVIGRPIYQARDPHEAAMQILAQVRQVPR